jgi:hypothetical protein
MAQRLLVVANEACAGSELFRELRERADGAEVLIVAPALASRLQYWLSDDDPGIAAAGRRLRVSVERCASAGITARGAVGDADPLQAMDDAVRMFAPDEIVVATHPRERANWLERGLVEQARARFDVPIIHVSVDAERDTSEVVQRRDEVLERAAPARERHPRRDLSLLLVVGVLAILGSLISFVFYVVDAPDWAIWFWVLVFDLGFKVAAMVALWALFQRRPRADRLDY